MGEEGTEGGTCTCTCRMGEAWVRKGRKEVHVGGERGGRGRDEGGGRGKGWERKGQMEVGGKRGGRGRWSGRKGVVREGMGE